MWKISLYIIIMISFTSTLNTYSQNTSTNPHNFSNESWSTRERCNPCHLKGISIQDYYLARGDSVDSDTLNVSGVPKGTTKLCLSCHDGISAKISHFPYMNNANDESSQLSSHPVSIAYVVTQRYGEEQLYDAHTTSSGLGGTIYDDLLENGRIECITCHDPHFFPNSPTCIDCPELSATAVGLGLRISNNKSALCLLCHKI